MNHLIIDLDKCIGCGKCVRMCLENNIVIEDRKAKEVGSKCLECSHCVSTCPKGAIQLMPHEDDRGGFFYNIKKDKMFDGTLLSEEDIRTLITAMDHGDKEKYQISVLQGADLNKLMRNVQSIMEVESNSKVWEGQQMLFIFADGPENALTASRRMITQGLNMGIRGFHSNIVMAAYAIDPDKIMQSFPNTTKRLQMAYVIGHARRLVEPAFKPLSKLKKFIDDL